MANIDEVLLYWLVSRRFGQQYPEEEEPKRRRKYRAHPVVSQRPEGHFNKLYSDLRQRPDKFLNYCRMSIPLFDRLLSDLRSGLTFKDTNMQQCITPEEQLILTLRFLATGNSFSSLHQEFLLRRSTISQIVQLTCKVIWQGLKATVMPQPKAEDWLQIAEGFYNSTQFPNCLGALDGKNIRVRKPPQSGSEDVSQEEYFSVVLLALSDSDYRFVMLDIGSYESSADADVFRASRMSELLHDNQFAIPDWKPLPGSSGPPVPYVMVADEAFGLSPHLMRPFPKRSLDDRKRIFNYRLTRARGYVDCAFGILCSSWRVLQSSLQFSSNTVTQIIQACVVLHNFIRMPDAALKAKPEHAPSSDIPVEEDQCGRPGSSGMAVRELYADYFLSPEGEVAWQMDANLQ